MRRPAAVLAGWSIFVWITRIKNANGDVGATLIALTFVVLAVAVAVLAWKQGSRLRVVALALAGYAAAVWLVRTPYILVHDHPGAFKAVHSVLAVLSIGLAAWVAWSAKHDVERERQAAATTAGLQELADR